VLSAVLRPSLPYNDNPQRVNDNYFSISKDKIMTGFHEGVQRDALGERHGVLGETRPGAWRPL
jgi:hypothetical protein